MQSIRKISAACTGLLLCLSCVTPIAAALETDRQQPLEVNANSTDGTLGDGVTTLRGDVDIRQGTLHIKSEEAEVSKVDGRVNSLIFRGEPAFLEQEIEGEGLVQATAEVIQYQVASGIVTLTGKADVKHPQYQISGELLTYDLNIQHFEGSADETGNGRIHIRLDPEVIDEKLDKDPESSGGEPSEDNPDTTLPNS
ncbi:MAG: lipopolysaccharide transport periplasmic protein LptA [Xanthomonadales bacterium]|nr:lipopolysaccharide transport periplasmic protein LptA [Xanthomonadales bacterium]